MKNRKIIESEQEINQMNSFSISDLEQQHLKKVQLLEADDLIYRIRAATGLTLEQSKIILNILFQEIRSLMLCGKAINLEHVGIFYISSPASRNNKVKILPRFKISNSLLNKMNL